MKQRAQNMSRVVETTVKKRKMHPSVATTTETVVVHDVIVVGAGIAGLACAADLRKRKLDVTVLEASAHLGTKLFLAVSRSLDDGPFGVCLSPMTTINNLHRS